MGSARGVGTGATVFLIHHQLVQFGLALLLVLVMAWFSGIDSRPRHELRGRPSELRGQGFGQRYLAEGTGLVQPFVQVGDQPVQVVGIGVGGGVPVPGQFTPGVQPGQVGPGDGVTQGGGFGVDAPQPPGSFGRGGVTERHLPEDPRHVFGV